MASDSNVDEDGLVRSMNKFCSLLKVAKLPISLVLEEL